MILLSESAKEKRERERFLGQVAPIRWVSISDVDTVFPREPKPVQSETATNALHQHQPAPAPKDWKTRVSEFLKRLVHNHPSR